MAPLVLGGNTPGSSSRVTPPPAILTSFLTFSILGNGPGCLPNMVQHGLTVNTNVFASASPGGGEVTAQGERGKLATTAVPRRAAATTSDEQSADFEVGRHLRPVDAVGLDAWAVTAPSARGISVRFR